MQLVKVWNLNSIPHVEMFKGKQIRIEPQSCIDMEFYEAYEFRGQFKPMIADENGKPKLPESAKMIRVVDNGVIPEAIDQGNTCMVCKYKAVNEKDLMAHITANHTAQAVRDEEAEKFLEDKKKKKVG